MRLYAIGFKNWVELRAAPARPKEEVTSVKVKDRLHGVMGQAKCAPYTIKVVHHKGGRVVKCVPQGTYLGGVYAAEGQCVEVPRDYARTVLKGTKYSESV